MSTITEVAVNNVFLDKCTRFTIIRLSDGSHHEIDIPHDTAKDVLKDTNVEISKNEDGHDVYPLKYYFFRDGKTVMEATGFKKV